VLRFDQRPTDTHHPRASVQSAPSVLYSFKWRRSAGAIEQLRIATDSVGLFTLRSISWPDSPEAAPIKKQRGLTRMI
jgi:hypothetical protein